MMIAYLLSLFKRKPKPKKRSHIIDTNKALDLQQVLDVRNAYHEKTGRACRIDVTFCDFKNAEVEDISFNGVYYVLRFKGVTGQGYYNREGVLHMHIAAEQPDLEKLLNIIGAGLWPT